MVLGKASLSTTLLGQCTAISMLFNVKSSWIGYVLSKMSSTVRVAPYDPIMLNLVQVHKEEFQTKSVIDH